MIGPIRLTLLTDRLNAASVSGIVLDDSQSCAVVKVVGGVLSRWTCCGGTIMMLC